VTVQVKSPAVAAAAPSQTRRRLRTRGADGMAISLGAGGKKKVVEPVMNVTPLVDVVLVLLIIFMVVTPLLSKNFWVHLPKQEKKEIEPEQLPDDPVPPLVLRVGPDHSLPFFDADDETDYGFAVEVLDQARDGGAVTIAPLVEGLTQKAAASDVPPDALASPPPAAAEAPPPAVAP
jgi:biopolymer transport protein TolR